MLDGTALTLRLDVNARYYASLWHTHFSIKPLLRTTRFAGVLLFDPLRKAWRRLSTIGVEYGGGFLDLAASQSKGVEEEILGVAEGGVEILYTILFLGVTGTGSDMVVSLKDASRL
jgi:hypothetical protein